MKWDRFSNPAPGYLPKRAGNSCPHKTHTWMSVAALFLIDKTWEQPRCPSGGKWINWSTQTVDYYSALERNEVSSHEKTWRELTRTWVGGRSQPGKTTLSNYVTFWKTLETVKNRWLPGGGREVWTGGAHRMCRAVKLLRVMWFFLPYLFTCGCAGSSLLLLGLLSGCGDRGLLSGFRCVDFSLWWSLVALQAHGLQ